MKNNNLETVLAYYAAINNKDAETAAEKLADNVKIITPLEERQGKEGVVTALKGFCAAINSLTINAKLADGDQVMLTYNIEFPKPIGNLRAAGLLTLENDLINCIELYYDARAVQVKRDEIFS
jgi:limonene-1,2-epoxide hydrolase